MSNSLLVNNDFFRLADTLGVELFRDSAKVTHQLSGSAAFDLDVFDTLPLQFTVRVVDSGVYPVSGKAGALAHVCGSLYLVALVDTSETHCTGYHQLWVVDGSKLGWTAQKPPVIFPTGWSRPKLYEAFVAGVVEWHNRSAAAVQWETVKNPRQAMQDYLDQKAHEETAATKKVAEFRALSVGEKFRTKGPRGV